MLAADSPTLLAVAQIAELLGVVGNHQASALVALAVNIMRPPVQSVDVQPPYHLFLVKIVPSIVTNASRLNAPRVALAGKSPAAIVAIATAVPAMVAVVIAKNDATGATSGSAGKLTSKAIEVMSKVGSLSQAPRYAY